jgi:hypothetical protein
MSSRHAQVQIRNGDLVWYGHDLGGGAGPLGGSDYEFWRTVRKAHLSALRAALGGKQGADVPGMVSGRFRSDVELAEFAAAHGIPTEFHSWSSGYGDD